MKAIASETATGRIKIPGKRTIIRKTLPLMVCEMSDALIIFTGIVFLSLEDEIYLAAIGLIDAILLCSLAYGHALSDAFQNFYARRRGTEGNKPGISRPVHISSIKGFSGVAAGITGMGMLLLWLSSWWIQNDILELLYKALPLLVPVIFIYYIALSFHSFLLGRGHLFAVGMAALGSFIAHLILLYCSFNMLDMHWVPTQMVLLALLLSELIWLLSLYLVYRTLGYARSKEDSAQAVYSKASLFRLHQLLLKVAMGPGVSALTFHLASALLFIYLSATRGPSEVAMLSLAMGYYALLLAPANGILAAATNGYARLYNLNREVLFSRFRKRLFAISLGMASAVGSCLVLAKSLNAMPLTINYTLLIGTTCAALISIRTRLDFVAVLARLRTDVYWRYQLMYALLVISGIALLQNWLGMRTLSLVLIVLMSQALIAFILQKKVEHIWGFAKDPERYFRLLFS